MRQGRGRVSQDPESVFWHCVNIDAVFARAKGLKRSNLFSLSSSQEAKSIAQHIHFQRLSLSIPCLFIPV